MSDLHAITRISDLTGKAHTMHLPVTTQEVEDWLDDPGAPFIQDAFSHLTPDEREFILTGITPDEWTQMVGDGDDE